MYVDVKDVLIIFPPYNLCDLCSLCSLYISNYAQNSPQGLKSPEWYSMLVDARNLPQGCQKASKT